MYLNSDAMIIDNIDPVKKSWLINGKWKNYFYLISSFSKTYV